MNKPPRVRWGPLLKRPVNYRSLYVNGELIGQYWGGHEEGDQVTTLDEVLCALHKRDLIDYEPLDL